MKDPRAAELLRRRLKYDWIVLFFGLFCVLLLLFTARSFDGFLFFLGCFVYVEMFSMSDYRKLQKGGEVHHTGISQILDQDVDAGTIFLCLIMDAFILILGTLAFFFMDPNQSVVWF
jgi:hypothetical protein